MPPEPDNNIDELLQAYAKKRREQMDAQMDVHPATRKLLQGEVARTFPKKPSAVESSFSFLKMFWPRIAFAVSILVVLGIGSFAMLRSNRGTLAERQTMKLSKLEPGAESKARALDESRSVSQLNESIPVAEKKVELGLNQPARENLADRIESLQLAPPNRLDSESILAKNKRSEERRVGKECRL